MLILIFCMIVVLWVHLSCIKKHLFACLHGVVFALSKQSFALMENGDFFSGC